MPKLWEFEHPVRHCPQGSSPASALILRPGITPDPNLNRFIVVAGSRISGPHLRATCATTVNHMLNPISAPLVTAITLGVRDVRVSRAFYVEGLGFELLNHVPGEIAFVRSAHGQMLALWNVASMPAEYGDVGHGPKAPPVSLGHNTNSADEVRRHYERALAAGATSISAPQTREWGGTSACIADPDGFRWDFVHNPAFTVGADGSVSI